MRIDIPGLDPVLERVDTELDDERPDRGVRARRTKLIADDVPSLPLDAVPNVLLWTGARVGGPLSINPVEGPWWNLEEWGLTNDTGPSTPQGPAMTRYVLRRLLYSVPVVLRRLVHPLLGGAGDLRPAGEAAPVGRTPRPCTGRPSASGSTGSVPEQYLLWVKGVRPAATGASAPAPAAAVLPMIGDALGRRCS